MTSPGTIILGSGSGRLLTAESRNNVLLGLQAGSNLVNGSNNIVIGGAQLSSSTSRNIIIGTPSTVVTNDMFVVGNATTPLLSGDLAAGNLCLAPTNNPNWGDGTGIFTLFNGVPPTAAPVGGAHLYCEGGSIMMYGANSGAPRALAIVGAPATSVAVSGGGAAIPPILIGNNHCGIYDTNNGIGISINGVAKTNISASNWNFSNQSIITAGGLYVGSNIELATNTTTPHTVNIGVAGSHQINIGNPSASTTIVAAAMQRSSIWYNISTILFSTVLTAVNNYGLIRCLPSNNLLTLQLPLAKASPGRYYIIVNGTGSNIVRVYPSEGDNIASQVYIDLESINDHTSVVSDGITTWIVI